MKIPTHVVICLTMLAAVRVFGQPKPDDAKIQREQKSQASAQSSGLIKFDLDFPGGTPNELIAAIQKATGRPLNAIVPIEFASEKLPPLKMNGVNVPQLFRSLWQASLSQKANDRHQYYTLISGFKSVDEGSTALSDDSIWYFRIEGNMPLPAERPQTRFFLLTPYLDHGLTVDDITTAIKTGWKMLGDSTPPAISFHRETKLLIAVGQPDQLATIESALRALNVPPPVKPISPPASNDKPASEQKKEALTLVWH